MENPVLQPNKYGICYADPAHSPMVLVKATRPALSKEALYYVIVDSCSNDV